MKLNPLIFFLPIAYPQIALARGSVKMDGGSAAIFLWIVGFIAVYLWHWNSRPNGPSFLAAFGVFLVTTAISFFAMFLLSKIFTVDLWILWLATFSIMYGSFYLIISPRIWAEFEK